MWRKTEKKNEPVKKKGGENKLKGEPEPLNEDEWVVVESDFKFNPNQPSPYSSLPAEVKALIMEFLPLKDVVNLGATEKESSSLARRELPKKIARYLNENPDVFMSTIRVEKKNSSRSMMDKVKGRNKFEDVLLISYYIHKSQIDTVKAFIDTYANNPDHQERFPNYLNHLLFNAINENKPEIVEHLLASGAKANCKNAEGYSPLGIAAQKENVTLCEILLRYDAKPFDKKLENLKQPISIIAVTHLLPSENSLSILKAFVRVPEVFNMLDDAYLRQLHENFHENTTSRKAEFFGLGVANLDEEVSDIIKNVINRKTKQNSLLNQINIFIQNLKAIHSQQGGQNTSMATRIELLNKLHDQILNNREKTPLYNVRQWIKDNPLSINNFSTPLIAPPAKGGLFSTFKSAPPDFSDEKFLNIVKAYCGKELSVLLEQAQQSLKNQGP